MGDGFCATHVVPDEGLPAREGPNAELPPVARLDPRLPVVVLDRQGDWAHIRCENGWEAWTDARLLRDVGGPRPQSPVASTDSSLRHRVTSPRTRNRWLLPLLAVVLVAAVVGAVLLIRGRGQTGSSVAGLVWPTPCTLLSPGEISPAFGGVQIQPGVDTHGGSCEWTLAGRSAGHSTGLHVIATKGDASIYNQPATIDPTKGEEAVPELGPTAKYVPNNPILGSGGTTPQIELWSAGYNITTSAFIYTGDRGPTKDDLIRLTRLVVGRIAASPRS